MLRFISGAWGSLFFVLQILTVLTLVAIALPLLWRFIHRRLLWSLNSRLILTYLLFGLAPIVLFGNASVFFCLLTWPRASSPSTSPIPAFRPS